MKKLTLTLCALLLSLSAHAEERRGSDLTYCLELPTAQLIAKCAGERSGGNKSATMSQAEVDKLLSTLPAPAVKEPVAQPDEMTTEEIKAE
ncbi:MAG: hypothetical protein PHI29_02320 [Gallionella sp.]|nr:hypothetical protein [Gallionella sp.]